MGRRVVARRPGFFTGGRAELGISAVPRLQGKAPRRERRGSDGAGTRLTLVGAWVDSPGRRRPGGGIGRRASLRCLCP